MLWLAVLLLNAALALVFASSVTAILALLLFTGLVFSIYARAPYYIVAVSPLLFFWSTELFSGIFIESGAFMVETYTIGEPTGAFSRLAAIYGLLLYAAQIVWLANRRQLEAAIQQIITRPRGFKGERWVIWSMAAIIAAFLLFGLAKGFPLLMGVDRFAYRADAGSKALISFLNNRYIMFGLLGLVVASGRQYREGMVLFLSLLAVSFLYGEKFTSIIMGSLFFCMPTAFKWLAINKKLPWDKVVMIGSALAMLVVPAILVNYGLFEAPDIAFKKLADRASLQGQLWYLADKEFGQIWAFDGTSIEAALRSLFVVNEQSFAAAGTRHGMYYVMQPFTDSTTLYWVMWARGAFVFAHMPYWLMVSGYTGAICIGLLTVSFAAWCFFKLTYALITRELVSSILWIKVLIWVVTGFTLGNFYFFFGFRVIILIAGCLLWENFVSKKLANKIKNKQNILPFKNYSQ